MRQFLMLAALGAMALAGCEAGVLVNNRPERETNWEAQERQQSAPTMAEPETASGTIQADEAGRIEAAPTTQPSGSTSAGPADADQRLETQDVKIESQSN